MIKKMAGFTIIEIIVVLALSAGVFMVAAGIFVQALTMQRRAFFIQRVQENIGFALESIAKEIRVSTIPTLFSNCPAFPAQVLNIVHPVNGSINFYFSNGNLHRHLLATGVDTILNSRGTKVSGGFCISGSGSDDNAQPRVTVLLTVSNGISSSANNISIDIQTTVSQRLLSD